MATMSCNTVNLNLPSLNGKDKLIPNGDHNRNVTQTIVFESDLCESQKLLENSELSRNISGHHHVDRWTSPESEITPLSTSVPDEDLPKSEFDAPVLQPGLHTLKESSAGFFPDLGVSLQQSTTESCSNLKSSTNGESTSTMTIPQQMTRYPSGLVEVFQAILLVLVSILFCYSLVGFISTKNADKTID